MHALYRSWLLLLQDAGWDSPRTRRIGKDLLQRWQEPWRCYHAVGHLAQCLQAWHQQQARLRDPHLVALALWFHDAVYMPRRSDNEERSAALALRHAAAFSLSAQRRQQLRLLIMATKHGQRAQLVVGDAALLCDMDLQVLAADRQDFFRYEAGIRVEYQHVPWPTYCRGRKQVLQGLLGTGQVFHRSPRGHERHRRAEANVLWALKRLESE